MDHGCGGNVEKNTAAYLGLCILVYVFGFMYFGTDHVHVRMFLLTWCRVNTACVGHWDIMIVHATVNVSA